MNSLLASGAVASTPTAAVDPEARHRFPFRPVRDEFQETILDCSRWVGAVTGEIQIQCDRPNDFKAWTLNAVGHGVREIPLGAQNHAVQVPLRADYETVYSALSAL